MSPSIVTASVTQTIAPTPSKLQQSGAIVSQGGTNTSPWTASLLTQLSDLTPLLNGAKSLASIAYSTGVVTATASAAHGLTIGDTLLLTIAGCVPVGYNGTYVCTVTTTTAFTYALASGPGSATTVGTYTPEDVAELLSQVTTYFSQGNKRAVYVLELGPGNADDGVAALGAYITANPNSAYTSGATGFFYSYLVPREWDGNANFLALLSQFESTTAKTYFFITTTLATYKLYTSLMKCAFTLIEAPAQNAYPANALTAISYNGGLVTATTTTAHGVTPGTWFSIAGVTPSGYNGTFLALPGTTASTLIYALGSNPGMETVLGTLVASYYASAGIPPTEFSCASPFYVTLAYNPSTTNKVTPTAFSFVFGVTPFPTRGNSALLTTLQQAAINVIGTGAEGGISDAMLLWGTTMDSRDFTYWYSVDWMQINGQLDVANEVINGSNNPINPLYYNQPGINRLQARLAGTATRGVTYGLVLGQVTQTELDGPDLDEALDAGSFTAQTVVNAVPFITYTGENPSDYKDGVYNGLSVTYTPARGFIAINFNINVTDFVSQ